MQLGSGDVIFKNILWKFQPVWEIKVQRVLTSHFQVSSIGLGQGLFDEVLVSEIYPGLDIRGYTLHNWRHRVQF